MPEAVVEQNAAVQQQVNGGPPQQTGWQVFQSLIGRMVMMYLVMQGMSYFRGKPANSNNSPASPSGTHNHQEMSGNIFAQGTRFDMHVYVSESDVFTQFDEAKYLFWTLENIEYGNWADGVNKDGSYSHSSQIELTQSMKNNGSIYIHVYFTEAGRSPDPNDKETYSKRRTFSSFKRLNKYTKKIYKKTKNLLTGDTDKDADYQQKAKENIVEVLSHWHPNLTINLLDDHTAWQRNSVPPPLNEYIEFDPITGRYYPCIYLNDYWNLNTDYFPINATLSHVSLELTYAPIQLWKWQLYLSQGARHQWFSNMLQEDPSDEDQDTIKRTLLETNPYLLILTVIVTLVHNVFEFLAFKNDIQFWKNRKSLEGLSVNSVLFGCMTSFIVLLYVLDNDTNTVVRISIGIGLLIDLWKVPKVCTIKLDHENKWFGIVPKVRLIYKTSYVESKTQDYDKLAFKYLSWILFPLVVCYSIYSLVYWEHKGWYSWLLNMIYGFLLTFGFIMMTPQLFINYKLKSVAHLPWRMMTYKALNTFIDDIFAFVIQMPTMYRIGCFRDDIIFFINLYQRWIYPIDKKRTNEFGTSGEDPTVDEQPAVAISHESENAQVDDQSATAASSHIKSD